MNVQTRHRIVVALIIAITLGAAYWIVETKGPARRGADLGTEVGFAH